MTPNATAEKPRHTVSVIMTVKNDPVGTRVTLESLLTQHRQPDEIVIVDGGSTDSTVRLLDEFAQHYSMIRVIRTSGANIASGRNIATQCAAHEIIASTDAGCRARPDWLANLVQQFEDDEGTEFVAGMYQIAPESPFEHVVGLATMRGQLEPVNPSTFNPSARSVAYTKSLWSRIGGWPEWLDYSEDTWFDHRVREIGAVWRFAENAVVDWRPRSTWRSLAKQFYRYGTGRGKSRIDAASFHYNLRNAVIAATLALGSFFASWMLVPLIAALFYFYVWTFHSKAMRVTRHISSWIAYLLTLGVMWVVLFSNLAGYIAGAWSRRKVQRDFAVQESESNGSQDILSFSRVDVEFNSPSPVTTTPTVMHSTAEDLESVAR